MIDWNLLVALTGLVIDCAGFILELVRFRFERLKAKNEDREYTALYSDKPDVLNLFDGTLFLIHNL